MKQISIQDLKGQLSSAISEAEQGSTILITRHNRPVAKLAPAGLAHVRVGKRYKKARLSPFLKTNTKGRYLEVLLEDRRGGVER